MFCASLSALLVVAAMLPSDAPAFHWNNSLAVMLWLILLVGWGVSLALIPGQRVLLDRVTVAVLVLTLLPLASGAYLAAAGSGNARFAWNLGWQWSAFGFLFLLTRQWLRRAADARMFAAMMLALAAGLSVYAVVDVVLLIPESRAEYQADQEATLRRLGIDPADSASVRHFEDRLRETEPTATFALTNSLAGFLAPSLVLLIAIAAANFMQREGGRWSITRPLAVALLLGVVLLFTESRAGVLGTLCGGGLLAVYLSPLGKRIDPRIVLGLGLLGVAVLVGGIASGAAPVEKMAGVPKSLLYRFEYWQATATMLRDYPWLGVGPGNFQDTYKHYQLPQSSENVNDPHNFIIEIWATSGALGLAMLLAVTALFVHRLWRMTRSPAETTSTADQQPTAPLRAHLAAAGVGMVLGSVCRYLDGYEFDWLLLACLSGGGLAALWLLKPWIERGTLTVTMVVAPLVALLVNLLAAGGIGVPGVATWVWLLTALALAAAGDTIERSGAALSRQGAYALLAGAVLLAIGFHLTVYDPVLRSTAEMGDANIAAQMGHLENAIEHATRAAEIDPWDSRPWQFLAGAWHLKMVRYGDSPALRAGLEQAIDEAIVRNPRSHRLRTEAGRLHLSLYRAQGNRGDLEAAIRFYREATERFPNHALAHAQLAWVLHLAGQDEAAREAADRALQLDSQHQHEEYKLANLRIDDYPPGTKLKQPPMPSDLTAEPLMQSLRTASIPESPPNKQATSPEEQVP